MNFFTLNYRNALFSDMPFSDKTTTKVTYGGQKPYDKTSLCPMANDVRSKFEVLI